MKAWLEPRINLVGRMPLVDLDVGPPGSPNRQFAAVAGV